MDNLLYKGFVALDDLKNRDVKTQRLKDDYLMKKQQEDDDRPQKVKIPLKEYKISLPRRPEVNATKVLNDPACLYHFLSSNDEPFFQSDNFQRKYLHELPKLLWATERMEDLGDFVLLFPNPDKKGTESLDKSVDNGILLKEAEEAFHLIFDTNYSYPYKNKFMTALERAYVATFLQLTEFVPPSEKIDEKENEGENFGAVAKRTISNLPDVVGAVEVQPPNPAPEKKSTFFMKTKLPEKKKRRESKDSTESLFKDRPSGRGSRRNIRGRQDFEISLKETAQQTERSQPISNNKPNEIEKPAQIVKTESLVQEPLNLPIPDSVDMIEGRVRPVTPTRLPRGLHPPRDRRLDKRVSIIINGQMAREYNVNLAGSDNLDPTPVKKYSPLKLLAAESELRGSNRAISATKSQRRITEENQTNPPDSDERAQSPHAEVGPEQSKDNSFEAVVKLEADKLRYIWGGGLYKDPKKTPNFQNKYEWQRSDANSRTSDFLTLIRKTVAAALSNQGFLIREIWVDGGRKIALVLTLPEPVAEPVLAKMGVSRTVEFCQADLLSLEPVDSKYRPFRVNDHLWDCEKWNKEYCKGKVEDEKFRLNKLRLGILELLRQECNMKKLVRFCGGKWPEPETHGAVYSPTAPKMEEWEAYHKYLVELSIRLHEIETNRKKMMLLLNLFHKERVALSGKCSTLRTNHANEILKFSREEVVRAMQATIKNNPLLHSIWSFFQSPPVNYRFKYQPPHNHMRPRNRLYYSLIWKQHLYKTGIGLYLEKTSKLERLKAGEHLVRSTICLKGLNRVLRRVCGKNSVFASFNKVSRLFFPLHNRKETTGKDYTTIFEPVVNLKRLIDNTQIERVKLISQLFQDVPLKFQPKAEPVAQELYEGEQLKIRPSTISATLIRRRKPTNQRPRSFSMDSFSMTESKNTLNFSTLGLSDLKKRFQTPQERLRSEALLGLAVIDKTRKYNTQLLENSRKYEINQRTLTPKRLRTSSFFSNKTMGAVSRNLINLREEYLLENKLLVSRFFNLLSLSRPLREGIPYLFTHRPIEEFISEDDDPKPLIRIFKTTFWNNLNHYPEKYIRNYFGERISLFFAFICAYRDWLTPLSIWGLIHLILFIVYNLNDDGNASQPKGTEIIFEIQAVLFVIGIKFWNSYFLDRWVVFKKRFNLKWGGQEEEEGDQVFESYESSLTRSLVTDGINEPDESINTKKIKATYFMTSIWIIVCFIGSYIVLAARRNAFMTGSVLESLQVLPVIVVEVLFHLIEFIRIKLFEKLYMYVLWSLVDWQNHKHVQSKEREVIINLFLFQLCNNSAHIFLISVSSFSGDLTLSSEERLSRLSRSKGTSSIEVCFNNSCGGELTSFYAAYCILQLIWTVVTQFLSLYFSVLIKRALRGCRKKYNNLRQGSSKYKDQQEATIPSTKKSTGNSPMKESSSPLKQSSDSPEYHKDSQSKSHDQLDEEFDDDDDEEVEPDIKESEPKVEQAKEQETDEVLNYEDIVKKVYTQKGLYTKIDKEIDHQVTLLSDKKDPLLEWTAALLHSHSSLILFGPLFGFSFPAAYIHALIEMVVARRSLFMECKRTMPNQPTSLNLWEDFMKGVSLLGIFTNSWYISMIVFEDEPLQFRLLAFISLLILLYVIHNHSGGRFRIGRKRFQLWSERVKFVENQLFKCKEVQKSKGSKNTVSMDISSKITGLNREGKTQRYPFERIIELKERKTKKIRERLEKIACKLVAFENLQNVRSNSISSPKSVSNNLNSGLVRRRKLSKPLTGSLGNLP